MEGGLRAHTEAHTERAHTQKLRTHTEAQGTHREASVDAKAGRAGHLVVAG